MLKKLKALYSFKESLSISDLGVVFILLIPIRMGIIKACKTINHNVLDLKNALGDLSGTSAILDYIQQYSPWILLEIVLFCIFAYVTASTIVCRLRHQRFSVWWSVPLVIVDLFFLQYSWVLVALLKGKKQNNSPLFVYLRKDDAAELRRLIAEGMDVNTEDDEEGEMPLMLASRYAAPACVRVLIEAGANVNYRDEVGDTPLHNACLWAALNNGRGAAEIVQQLLRAGADASVINEDNETPANYAKLCYRGKFCLALLNGELPLDAPIPEFTVEDGVTVESVQEELNRKAVLFRSTLAPDNHDWQGSCLGCVCRQLPGETAPLNAEGKPLMPLATLFLKDLPWVPEELKGIALITVFGPKPDDIYDYKPEELAKGFVIRTYESLDGLESCEYLTTDFTPCTLTPEFVQNDQIQALGQLTDSALRYKINMLEEALGIDYDKDIKQTQYEIHKIGGYPNYAQDIPDNMPERFRYVFQICSVLDANLCIGDCGSIFFYYDPQAKEWNVYWDCS